MVDVIRDVQRLLSRAKRTRLKEPTAMTLATADLNGRPTVRTVLLKGVSERGFVFFTNLGSRKGKQLRANPRAALCFFWEPLDRQLIVDGRVTRVSEKEADDYWKTRPRTSQLGAWASHQSQPLNHRSTLTRRLKAVTKRFSGKPVPRPVSWSGFCVRPERIEFWRRGAHRLHHRLVYVKRSGRWTAGLLNP